ncbi:unnamed protein product [Phytophthora lilii]|uniref:Unnamed protein product n=1 Tax=Phytophthora lilii TaxID=2077276 RepID=A0A9W6TCC4_9STRA|nr:unnamed protein product [Phytophthora lilii]
MAHLAIKKQEFLGAVTLVSFSSDGSLLYVGAGPTVFLYATATGELLGEHHVLTRGILHGCDVVALPDSSSATEAYVGAFFGQKRVACFQDLPQTPEAARATESLVVLGKPKVFCDWVFDVQLLTGDVASKQCEELLVAVGLAHNFVQIWDPLRNDVLRSVQCAERCILYALAFHGRSLDELVVASGTVFQQILLWNPNKNAGEIENSAVEPAQRLHAHDGVLFKLAWSMDARSLASVSDDRTVQLWSNNEKPTVEQLHLHRTSSRADLLAREYSPVFRAWGHSARLWDVSFWESGVVTASEDGLCKLWDIDGNCVATLQGHMGRHVWRVAVHPSRKIVATGGGDGAAKLWSIPQQLMSSSNAPEANNWRWSIRVPITIASTGSRKKKSGQSSQSVRDIVLSSLDNGKTAFVASEHGDIFRLDLSSHTAEPFFTIPQADGSVHTRTGGLSTFALSSSGRFLLLGDVAGRVRIVEALTGKLLYSWTAHINVRIMKIWWDQGDALFISSASGILSEWKPSLVEASENLASPSVTMELSATYKIPAKSSMSSILVVDRSATTRNIIGGDGHGNVYIFHRTLLATDTTEPSVQRTPALVFKGVNGRELVASLLFSEENGITQNQNPVLLSGGHDGYICFYSLKEDANGSLTATQNGRESIRGISTVKKLWWSPLPSNGKAKSELMVFGFHAAQAVLHNFSAQYRIFNVECGGWRRPHALFTRANSNGSALPAHTFIFTPPSTQKQQVDISVHSTLLDKSNDASPLFSRCSLHDQHHGRMTTCVAFLGNKVLVTAAEDNSLMLHRRRVCSDQNQSTSLRWSSVATGIAHTTTVRALTAFQRESHVAEHIVLSGGGKQRLNVWLVREESDLLRQVCGQERAGAEQDHRILGLETFAIPSVSDAYRVVTASNSEGSTQILLLDVNHGKLLELGDCRSASRKPILSCVGFQEGHGDATIAGLAVGSTDGLVTLWDLSAVLKDISSLLQSNEDLSLFSEKLHGLISCMQPSGSYLAHDMGTNCINLVSCASRDEDDSLDVTLISGGDDQNLYLRKFRFPACKILSEARTINASGSAIKTVACLDSQTVFAAGYDQRVSKWGIVRGETGTKLEWQGAAFSECADIADLAVRQNSAEVDEVVVVGQGLQMMAFQR